MDNPMESDKAVKTILPKNSETNNENKLNGGKHVSKQKLEHNI